MHFKLYGRETLRLMKSNRIISQAEALQILRNDLRRTALKHRTSELDGVTPEKRATILAEIEREVEQEIQRRAKRSPLKNFFSAT